MPEKAARRGFDWEESQQLAKGVPFYKSQAERQCPACGVVAIRSYVYFSDEERTRIISTTWCGNCLTSSGSVGPEFGVSFDDPLDHLSQQERMRLTEGGDLIEYYNDLWNRGILPQRFHPSRR